MSPARIPREIIKARRKPNPRRSIEHLAFIRSLPCLACGAAVSVQAAHVRSSGDGGVGIKPGDKFSLPLCAACHHTQHQIGEPAFFGKLGIDPTDTALRLWTVSGDRAAGERLIFRARQAIALKVALA